MTKELKRDFFDEVMPLVEKRLDNMEENYDDLMVSFVGFTATTLLEKTIHEAVSGNIDSDQFSNYLAGQLERTLETITNSTKLLYKKYMMELEEQGLAQRVPPDHPTVQ